MAYATPIKETPKLKKYTTNGNEHYASCHLIDLPEIN